MGVPPPPPPANTKQVTPFSNDPGAKTDPQTPAQDKSHTQDR